MSSNDITADEARKNSQSSHYGAEDVLKRLESSIKANSKAGKTSIISMFSIEGLSTQVLEQAISTLVDRGFKASYALDSAVYKVNISW
ncbi:MULTISPECIES: hypothetical protein [Enterobacterales]|uniref:hypothetical protein n=1 Tax=Enterobacterales TaxID=91347 RepID=UPI000D60DA76|nr:hypothetical protein [Pectobacterium versatile]PWD70109.1 hypothetical protein DF215_09505 [Pectobacterium versatile]